MRHVSQRVASMVRMTMADMADLADARPDAYASPCMPTGTVFTDEPEERLREAGALVAAFAQGIRS